MLRKTKADAKKEKWITCLHESAHVVFAMLSGRKVRWVTIKPKKIMVDCRPYMSLGRWDIDDKRNENTMGIEEKKQHIHTTLAGVIVEDMVTGMKEGGQDMGIALAYCERWGFDFEEMMKETTSLIGEHCDEINRLASMLMEHKTLDETQIKQSLLLTA